MTIDKKFSKLFCLFIIGSVESHGVKDSKIDEKTSTHENLSIPFEGDIFQIMDKKASFEEKIQLIFQLHEKNICVRKIENIVHMDHKRINKILDKNGLKRDKKLTPEDKKKIPHDLMTPMFKNDSLEEKEKRIKALLLYKLSMNNIGNIVKLNGQIFEKIFNELGGKKNKNMTIPKKNLENVPEALRKDMSENDPREKKEERIKALLSYKISIFAISHIVKLNYTTVVKIVDEMGGERKKKYTIYKKNLENVPEGLKKHMSENNSREEKEKRVKALLPYGLSITSIVNIVKLHHEIVTKIVDEMGGERKKKYTIYKKNLENVPEALKKHMSENDSREEKEERIKALLPYELSMKDISHIVKLHHEIVTKIVDEMGGERKKRYTIHKKNLKKVPEDLKKEMFENDSIEEKKERIKALLPYKLSIRTICHIVKLHPVIVTKIVDEMGGEREKKYTIHKKNLKNVPEALRKDMSENDSREEKEERIKALLPYELSIKNISNIVKLDRKIVSKIVDKLGGERKKKYTIYKRNLEKVPEDLKKEMFENDSIEEKKERIKVLMPFGISMEDISHIVKLHSQTVGKIVDKLGGEREKKYTIHKKNLKNVPEALRKEMSKNDSREEKEERIKALISYGLSMIDIGHIVKLDFRIVIKILDKLGGERKKKYNIYKRNLEKVPEDLKKEMFENDSIEEKKERIKVLMPFGISMEDISHIVKLHSQTVGKIVDKLGGEREKKYTIYKRNLKNVPEALRKEMSKNDSREEKEERIKALLPYKLSMVDIGYIVKLNRKIVAKIVDKLGGQRKRIMKEINFNPKKLGIPLELLEQLDINIDLEIKKERTIQLLMYSMPINKIKKIVRLDNLYISKIADDYGLIIRKYHKS